MYVLLKNNTAERQNVNIPGIIQDVVHILFYPCSNFRVMNVSIF